MYQRRGGVSPRGDEDTFGSGLLAEMQTFASANEKEDNSKKSDEEQLKRIRDWHWGYVFVQTLSGVAILTLLLILKYGQGKSGFTGYLFTDTFDLETETPIIHSVGSFEVGFLLVPMPFLTALSHLIQLILINRSRNPKNTWAVRYVEDLKRGVNAFRWIEYSITASLMTSILFLLCGGTNVYLFFLLGVACNMAMQWQGYQFELLMDNPKFLERCSPMIAGFIIFTAQWAILWTMFALTIAENAKVPWFVYASFIGVFVTFLVFPAIQIMRYFKWWIFKKWFEYEFYFNIASNGSKLYLDWILAIAVIVALS